MHPHPLVAEITALLVSRRAACGISQEDLAARMGIAQPRISQIERGHDRSYVSVCRYAEALGFEITFGIRPRQASSVPASDLHPHPVELVRRLTGADFCAGVEIGPLMARLGGREAGSLRFG